MTVTKYNLGKVLNLARLELIECVPDEKSIIEEHWPKAAEVKKGVRSNFDANTMGQLRNGRINRHTIEDYWLSRGEDLTKEEWAALVIASSILNGGLCKKKYVMQLLRKPIYSFLGYMWAELNETGAARHLEKRWFFDYATALLFINRIHQFGGFESVSWTQIDKRIRRIFKVRSIDELRKNAIACYRFEQPAYVVAFYTGDLISISSSLLTWIRMTSGKTFHLDAAEIHGQPKKIRDLKRSNIINPDYHRVKRQITQLQESLRIAEESPWTLSRNGLKKKIKKRLRKVRDMSIFVAHLLEFTEKLIKDGRKRKDLTISSVRTYFNSLATYLHEETWGLTCSESLDEERLAAIYTSVLDSTTDKNRPRLASLLQDFHHFIQLNYYYPEIDFHDLEPRCISRSVRTSVLTEKELILNSGALPKYVRIHQSIAVNARLRAKELKRIRPQNLVGDSPVILSIDSTSGRKTKSYAGFRKVVISTSNNEEIIGFKDYCRENQVARFGEIIGERERRRLQQSLREITGDANLVTHSLRDTGATMDILRNLVPVDYWPPGFFVEGDYGKKKDVERQKLLVGTIGKERRLLWLEAILTGHTNPGITFAAYFHFNDFISMNYCNEKQVFSYQFLGRLTSETYENLRTIRSRKGNSLMGKNLVSRALESHDIPVPSIVYDLVDYPMLDQHKKASYPSSLKLVLESIRLHLKGCTKEVIADQLEVEKATVNNWIENMERVKLYTGYKFDNSLLKKKPWQGIRLSDTGKRFDEMFCKTGYSDKGIWGILIPFKERFVLNRRGLYLKTKEEAADYKKAISEIGIENECVSVVISKSHQLENQKSYGFPSLSNLQIQDRVSSKKVIKARTCATWSPPGLGVVIKGPSGIDTRYLLEDEVFVLAAAAWCVLGV